jgi:hypothetical protein
MKKILSNELTATNSTKILCPQWYFIMSAAEVGF